MPEAHELMATLAESLLESQCRLVIGDIRDTNKAQAAGKRAEVSNLTRQVLRIVQEHIRFGNPLFLSVGTAQIYIVDRRADAAAECVECHVGLPVHVEEQERVSYFLKCPNCGGNVVWRQ